MNQLNAVATQDLVTRLTDLKDQIASLSTIGAGYEALICLASANASIATCLDLNSISFTVAERILWYVQEACSLYDDIERNLQPVLALADDILSDMPLPYRVVSGVS